jgi:hypothetical protein
VEHFSIEQYKSQPSMGLLTVQDVIAAHRSVEQYVRRVFFIALRINSVQYQTAEDLQTLVRNYDVKALETAWKVLTQHPDFEHISPEKLIEKHADLAILLNLWTDYATPLRYRLSQNFDEAERAAAFRTTWHICQSLITELERVTKAEFGHSIFDSPKNWGAKTINTPETLESITQRLGLEALFAAPIDLQKVKKQLSKTAYSL